MTARVPDHASLPVEQLVITEPTLPGPHFWSCDDGDESLSHTEIEDAVYAELEHQAELNESIRATIARLAPLKVYGYTRDSVCDQELARLAERTAEEMEVWFEECTEYGSPDGDGDHPVLSSQGRTMLEAGLNELLRRVRAAGHLSPWTCSVTAVETLSEAALLEMFASEIRDDEADRLPPPGGNRSTEGGATT